MNEQDDVRVLAESVRSGERSFESALEEALGGDDFDDPLDDVYRVLGYFNVGDRDRTVAVDGVPENVGEFVARHGLQPFVALLDAREDSEFSIGSVMSYGGSACRVIGRRVVSPFATPRFDDYELLIESLGGGTVGFVGESEVQPVDADEAGEG